MRKKKQELGLTSAVIAAALGAVGVDEDNAIAIGRSIHEEYGTKFVTEENTRALIRRVKQIQAEQVLRQNPNGGR